MSEAAKKKKKEWAREYRQRPEVKARAMSYTRSYRANPENRERLNEKTRRWRKLPSSRRSVNAARRAWSAREKAKAIEYMGGECVGCGYNRCQAAMDFHHLDPSQKEGYGTSGLRSHWTFEKNKPEIDKCVLLCVRCHREVHAGARVL